MMVSTASPSRRTLGTLFAVVLALPLLQSAPAFSTSAGEEHHGEKVQHYKVAVPKTKEAATKMLTEAMAKIEKSLAASDFNAIHEATYSVESALARIAKEPGFDGVSVTVAPRVEIVHLASELGDGETLKAAVPLLVKSVKDQGLLAAK